MGTTKANETTMRRSYLGASVVDGIGGRPRDPRRAGHCLTLRRTAERSVLGRGPAAP